MENIDRKTSTDIVSFHLTRDWYWLFVFIYVGRFLFDRLGYGSLFGALIIATAFAVVALTGNTAAKKSVAGIAMVMVIMVGYYHAVLRHGTMIYPLRGVVRYSTYAAAFFLAYHGKFSFRRLSHLLFAMILLQAPVVLYQSQTYVGRPFGTLINNNHIMYLLVLVFSILYIARHKILYSVAVVLGAVFLGGMGGTIAMAGVLITYGTTHLKGKARAAFFVTFMVLSLAFVIQFGPRFTASLNELSGLRTRIEESRPGGGESLIWRLVTWAILIDDARDNNAVLLGRGIDYASDASPYFYTLSRYEPHNDYVRIVLEFGLLGLFAFAIGIVSLSRHLTGMASRDPDRKQHYLSLKYALYGLLAGMLVGNIITQSTLWWSYFALLGSLQHASRGRQTATVAVSAG